MFSFSCIDDYYKCDLEDMKESYNKLQEIMSNNANVRKYKYGYSRDAEKNIVKLVVASDFKEFDEAHRFLDSGKFKVESLSTISNKVQLFEEIKKIIFTVEKERKAMIKETVLENEIKEMETKNGENNGENNGVFVLPDISEKDNTVYLVERDGYIVTMQKLVNAETKRTDGYMIYLTSKETMLPLIGSTSEIRMKASKLEESGEHNVMGVIRDFDVKFSENDIKVAFERAKEFAQKSKQSVEFSTSKEITKAYVDLVKYAITRAEFESKDKTMVDERKCFLHEKSVKDGNEIEVIAIRDKFLQKALDDTDSGYTKTIFCKKLNMLGALLGEKILIINRKNGYSYNTTNNVRYYKFIIIKSLLEKF